MEHQKILNLLNEEASLNSWQENETMINDQSNWNYDEGNEINYKTEILKSNLFDYNDAYVFEIRPGCRNLKRSLIMVNLAEIFLGWMQ